MSLLIIKVINLCFCCCDVSMSLSMWLFNNVYNMIFLNVISKFITVVVQITVRHHLAPLYHLTPVLLLPRHCQP